MSLLKDIRMGLPPLHWLPVLVAIPLAVAYYWGDRILSVVLNATWTSMSPVIPIKGNKPMPGPPYVLPQGQAKEKIIMPHQMSTKWREEYGPIYRSWDGMWSEIIITDAKDVETWFTGKGEHSKFLYEPSGSLFNYAMGSAVGLINGHDWKMLRKLLDPYVSFQASARLTPMVVERAHEHVRKLTAQTTAPSPSKKIIVLNAYQFIQPFPFFTQMETFYGALTDAQQQEIWSIGQDFLTLSTWTVEQGITRIRVLKWMYSWQAWTLIWQFDRRWRAFNREIVRQKAEQKDLPIIRLWQNIRDGQMTEDQLIHTFTESIFANLDVTTSVITGCILHIAEEPEIQRKLQKEIDESKSNLAEYVKRQDTFMQWCFLKSIRLEPIPAFSLAGRCTEDKVLGGYLVPAGTSVTIDAVSTNINNPFWGPDTREYRPERFAGLTHMQLRYNLSTFGYGSRKCLGVHLGGKMVRGILAALFGQYNVQLEGQAKDGDRFKTDKTSFFAMYLANIELVPRE